MQSLTIVQPDDWHLHLRNGDLLKSVLPYTAERFNRAIVMPNLTPPVTDVSAAKAYYNEIMEALPKGVDFTPLMTLYLTDNTSVQDIIEASESDNVVACKLYPANATTNSAHGVTDILKLDAVFEEMAKRDILLLIHGEVTHSEIDIFDREKIFIETILSPLIKRHPKLKVVLEHITTKDAAEFVLESNENLAATITPQHLMLNRNDLLVGGIRPHNYCLPILKRNIHQKALQEAVKSGSPKFFLGTDSAPHFTHLKESSCGCAGCFSANCAIELYAEIFDQLGAIDKLEAFASFNGPDFYGLPRNTKTITLSKTPQTISKNIETPEGDLTPFLAGQTIHWSIQ